MEDLACFVDRFLAGLALEKSDNGQRSGNVWNCAISPVCQLSGGLSIALNPQDLLITTFCVLIVAARSVNARHAM
jgi:hypothetical protein